MNTSSPVRIRDKGGGRTFQAGRRVQEPGGACKYRYDKKNGGAGGWEEGATGSSTYRQWRNRLRVSDWGFRVKVPSRQGISASAFHAPKFRTNSTALGMG